MLGNHPRRLAAAAVLAFVAIGPLSAGAVETPESPSQGWSFEGIFGTFDRPALRRGYQVYAEVCESCHSLNLLAYHNLQDIGFGKEEVRVIAGDYQVEDGPNDDGEMYMRPAMPFDRMVPPFANEQAARAANAGAFPPDLSVITKARDGGADYLYALLTGYLEEPPEGVELMDGLYYNTYFPSHQIAMAPVVWDDLIEYEDGTKATAKQISRDVSVFLAWAAEPELEERKGTGILVMLFLIVLTAMLYALKRRIWADVH